MADLVDFKESISKRLEAAASASGEDQDRLYDQLAGQLSMEALGDPTRVAFALNILSTNTALASSSAGQRALGILEQAAQNRGQGDEMAKPSTPVSAIKDMVNIPIENSGQLPSAGAKSTARTKERE